MPEVWQTEVSPHLLYKISWAETALGTVRERVGMCFPPPQLGARATRDMSPLGRSGAGLC